MRGIVILNGRARLNEPTKSYKWWRIIYKDPITGKQHITSGGKTRESAENKAATLLGDFVPDPVKGVRPPTFKEVSDQWLDEHEGDWSENTRENYRYIIRRFILPSIGETPITMVSQSQLHSLPVSSREYQVITRRLIKSIMTDCQAWTHRDPSLYAKAVRVEGGKKQQRSYQVQRGDIPSSKLVASFIITAYGTLQSSPLDDPRTTSYDLASATKTRSERTMQFAPGLGVTEPTDYHFIDGIPFKTLYPSYRRPCDIDDLSKRNQELSFIRRKADFMRRCGLVTALGAAGGFRIGEVLALRVRHLLSKEQIMLAFQLARPREQRSWRGEVHVCEQITRGGIGQVRLTTPKYSHDRTVHLPMFLPNWNGFGIDTTRDQIAEIIPRFTDKSASLWTATDEECRLLWLNGFCPVGQLVWNRLEELWDTMPRVGKPSMQQEIRDFGDLLLFPAVGTGNKVTYESGWPYDTRIVEGAGGYQYPSNYMKTANAVYDYCSSIYDEWPINRVNSRTRKGWTHHALRHYAASSRIQAGVPLPIVARELGHKDAGFTLQRYGHMMQDAIPSTGFEY